MRFTTGFARFILGLMFSVFGVNGFLGFIAIPPKPAMATDFIQLLQASGYMAPVFAIQVAAGLLFLSNRFVPLALTLVGPVLLNILLFHVTMDLAGIVPGVVAAVCWAIVFHAHRDAFVGLFRPGHVPTTTALDRQRDAADRWRVMR